MSDLSERQKVILSLVVHEYVRTANPVGSKSLVNQYHLDYSPATVRNELAALTEEQYLSQPYTSAGRVPTEKGYRFFVSGLIQMRELPEETRRMIEHQFSQAQQGMDGWISNFIFGSHCRHSRKIQTGGNSHKNVSTRGR